MRLPGTVPKLLPVKSSNVDSIGYDYSKSILYVAFMPSDKVKRKSLYKYLDVPKKIYERMISAPSKGKYLNKYVKGKFRYLGWSGFGWRQDKTLQNRAVQNRIKKARWRAVNK
jgi:hypothetical protein